MSDLTPASNILPSAVQSLLELVNLDTLLAIQSGDISLGDVDAADLMMQMVQDEIDRRTM